ncbi:hypothetical protein [Pseudorhodoferax soli]|uniref:Uncharacterized protein n=1 Tax=Pseudorhodoferax soli TaxID=545864 RepID=A0A368XQ36_9BURK|nr:hypothetical protein [Pseudorhodoferax soli]RCW70101.1 hypothetical protein DES41_10537 [Pseudorhodoferax soli]
MGGYATLSRNYGALAPRALNGRTYAAAFGTRHDPDGTAHVSVEGHPSMRVMLRTSDHHRLVGAYGLTGTRWVYEDGEVRAYALGPGRKPIKDHTYSVAALILGAQDGDVIHMEDCLDLRPERMRLERRGGH